MKQFWIFQLKLWLKRLESDECTADELDSLANIAKEKLTTYMTIDEAADLLGKDKKLIHASIQRNRYGDKLRPKRKVLYNFMEVLKILPKTWFKKK